MDYIDKPIIIGITHGDINGISYEVMLKALKEHYEVSSYVPVIYGSPKVAAYYKKVYNLDSLLLTHIPNVDSIDYESINIINCVSNNIKVDIGKSTQAAADAAYSALKAAVADAKNKKLDAIITAPINKFNISQAGFNFKGHTDYLKHEFGADDVLMFMICDDVKIAVATEHVSLKEVSTIITTELILSKLRLMKKTLQRDFGIVQPRIAVLGLNPHCGDNGIIGDEDDKVVYPAIEIAQKENILAFGPFSADAFFGYERYEEFDAILAMYHDQGLIPFKILARGGGVNFTAGLPIIRTSPAHGTAYEIAGRNLASIKSMFETLNWTIKIVRNRRLFDSIIPLQTDASEHQIEEQ